MVTGEKFEDPVVNELVGVDAPDEVDVVELGQRDAVVVDEVGQPEEVLDVCGVGQPVVATPHERHRHRDLVQSVRGEDSRRAVGYFAYELSIF